MWIYIRQRRSVGYLVSVSNFLFFLLFFFINIYCFLFNLGNLKWVLIFFRDKIYISLRILICMICVYLRWYCFFNYFFAAKFQQVIFLCILLIFLITFVLIWLSLKFMNFLYVMIILFIIVILYFCTFNLTLKRPSWIQSLI